MGARDLTDDDSNVLRKGVDGVQNGRVHLMDERSNLLWCAALGQGDLDERHSNQLRRMNGSATGSSLVFTHTLLSRVYSFIVSVPCSMPTPLFLKP